jgi:xylulokinase
VTVGGLVAGVDCSTQATKVLVVDPDSGRVLGSGRASHMVSGTGGARETDAREWWTALGDALGQAGHVGDIGAIAIGGQQHGLVALGRDGEPLRPAMLWNDTRSATQAEELIRALGAKAWADLTGSVPPASFTVTKWAWLRVREPEVAAATIAIRLPHDYLTERLAGRGVTDRGDASGTGWWSTATGDYAAEILGLPAVDLDPALLPTVLGPLEAAGAADGGAELGLGRDVLVGPGTGDNMGAALGLGLRAGEAAISLGTSGTLYAVSDRRPRDPSGVVSGFADATGRYLPLAATLNCTQAVDRMAALLRVEREDVTPSGEVVALPWFDGERTPALPDASALVTGLRADTTPSQILMATYEGAAASLVEALEAIAVEAGGLDPQAPLALIGGGARGRVWRDVVLRLTGRPIRVPQAEELVALGAAIQATAVLRGEEPAAVAERWGTAHGELLDPLPRDDERLARIAAVRDAVAASTALTGRSPSPAAEAP